MNPHPPQMHPSRHSVTTCCASPPPCPGHGEHPAPWAQAHTRPSSHPQRPTEGQLPGHRRHRHPSPANVCVHTHSLDRRALAEPMPPARPSRTQALLDESRNHRPEAQRAWGVGPRRVPMNCGGGEINLRALRLLVWAFYLRRELDLEVGCPRCPSPSSSSHRLPTSVWSGHHHE